MVQWTMVQLMLILEILLDLTSKQGDVTAAFLYETLEESAKVYVNMPLGFQKTGKVLKLNKILYRLQQSPCAFWKYLTNAMLAVGMQVSKLDPYIFIGDGVMSVILLVTFSFGLRIRLAVTSFGQN